MQPASLMRESAASASSVRSQLPFEPGLPPINGTPLERSRRAADASRGIIWQGNCDAAAQQSCSVYVWRSNFALPRITLPIEIPISNCPAKSRRLRSNGPIGSDPAFSLTPLLQLCRAELLPIESYRQGGAIPTQALLTISDLTAHLSMEISYNRV